METLSENKWIICRICLKNSDVEMLKLFSMDAEVEHLVARIEECGGIALNEFDNLPDSICSKCLKLLKVAHKFRALCQKSHQQLVDTLQLQLQLPTQVANEKSNHNIFVCDEPQKEETNSNEVLASKCGKQEEETESSVYFVLKQENESNQDDSSNDVGYIMEMDIAGGVEVDLVEGELLQADQLDAETIENPDSTQSDDVEYLEDDVDDMIVERNTFTNNGQIMAEQCDENTIQSAEEELSFEQTDELVLSENDEPKSKIQIISKRKLGLADGDGDFKVVERFTQSQKRIRKYKSKSTNKSDNKTDEESQPTFICFTCGNIYAERAKLTLHLKMHNKDKPHECEICHKRFAQTPQLSRHMNSHTGRRPFKCKFCPASFADPSTCIKHQRIHTNERPYKCKACGKAFSYSNVLKVHMMIHTGEKPYCCEYCGKKFAQLHHKKAHVRTHNTQLVKQEEDESITND